MIITKMITISMLNKHQTKRRCISPTFSLYVAKDSGPARDSIRDSIDRIEFTDFQLHELTGRWLSENMPEGFKSDRFRF